MIARRRCDRTNKVVQSNEAFRYHWTIWRLTGVQTPTRVPKCLYYCYAVAINCFITLLFPLTLMANLFHTRNLQELCENLTITITDINANLKFLNVFYVRSKLLKIKRILDQLDKSAHGNAEECCALKAAVKIAHVLFQVFGIIYIFGTCLSLCKVAMAKKRLLLYPAWFPTDWKHSDSAYTMVLAYQLCGLIVQACQNCANDSYPPAYLCILCGHMRALELRVRKIGKKSIKSMQRRRKEILEQNFNELVACIKDHVEILELHATIQQIISNACFVQFICSALVQCTIGLHFLYIVNDHDLSAQVLSIIFFLAVTLEVFIICYFGHYMRKQSEDLTHAFYSCNWIDQLPKFKKHLIISLIRTQRPCAIFAGNYIPVDLLTFMQFMKYTYSIYTLLLKFK